MNPSTHRDMTDDERSAAAMLKGVSFPMLSYDNRMGKSFWQRVDAGSPKITERETPQLWRIFHRYRRQIHSHPGGWQEFKRLVNYARDHSAPQFNRLTKQERKVQADKAELERLKAIAQSQTTNQAAQLVLHNTEAKP